MHRALVRAQSLSAHHIQWLRHGNKGSMTHKILSPACMKCLKARVFYMSYCQSECTCLIIMASVANVLYIIKLLYDSTLSM